MSEKLAKQLRQLQQELIEIKGQRQVLERVEVVQTKLSAFSGPAPSPEMVEQYNRAEPGLGTALVQNAIEESNHRREMERTIVNAETGALKTRSRQSGWGLAIGALITFLALIVIGGTVYLGHAMHAAAMFAVLAVLAGVFVGVTRPKSPTEDSQSQDV